MKKTHYALEVVQICLWLKDNHPDWKVKTVRADDTIRIESGDRLIIDSAIPEAQKYLKQLKNVTVEHS
jgi:uncharacterized lipoprotein YddW (UPF0748 family)